MFQNIKTHKLNNNIIDSQLRVEYLRTTLLLCHCDFNITSHCVFGFENFAIRALANQLVDGETTVWTGNSVQTEPLTQPVIVHRVVRCGQESII